MANSVHSSDSLHVARGAGQPPIVLARLPRVGQAAPFSVQPATASFAPPETMPQLDLHTEIDHRVQLPVANTPSNRGANRFADQQHSAQPEPAVRQPATIPWMIEDDTPRQHTSRSRPTTLSEKVFQLHSQLSPHAGLIVALALIASAGLLYWMIVGPRQAHSPQFEHAVPMYGDDSFGANMRSEDSIPDDYLPSFSALASKPPAPSNSTEEQWTKVPLPAPPATAPAATSQPAVDPGAVEPQSAPARLNPLPATDPAKFPLTTRPEQLDYSRLRPTRLADGLLPLPEIARAPADTLQR